MNHFVFRGGTLQKLDFSPKLLVASPQLTCPYFAGSVILLLEHTPEGALGFVLNRPSHLFLDQIIKDDLTFIPKNISVWRAGPVASETAFVLHNQNNIEYDKELCSGIFLSSSISSLESILKKENKTFKDFTLYPYRVCVGYSSWGDGQLDQELKDGFWVLADIHLNLVFNTSFRFLWKSCLSKLNIEIQGLEQLQNPSFFH